MPLIQTRAFQTHRRKRALQLALRCLSILAVTFAASLALPLSVQVAKAELTLCNQSLDVLNVALGYESGGDFQTEGWWSIGANRCSELVRKPLTSRYYYLYAEDVFGQAVFEGDIAACVDAKKFVIKGAKDCWTRGRREARFSEVDTLSQEQWTVFLKGAE
jgi:uncharacterized membrane protein